MSMSSLRNTNDAALDTSTGVCQSQRRGYGVDAKSLCGLAHQRADRGGRKAAQGWIEGLVRLHRRQIDEARIERLEYETDEGAWDALEVGLSCMPTKN